MTKTEAIRKDIKWLVGTAVTAGIAGFCGYIGWDCGRTFIVWVLETFGT